MTKNLRALSTYLTRISQWPVIKAGAVLHSKTRCVSPCSRSTVNSIIIRSKRSVLTWKTLRMPLLLTKKEILYWNSNSSSRSFSNSLLVMSPTSTMCKPPKKYLLRRICKKRIPLVLEWTGVSSLNRHSSSLVAVVEQLAKRHHWTCRWQAAIIRITRWREMQWAEPLKNLKWWRTNSNLKTCSFKIWETDYWTLKKKSMGFRSLSRLHQLQRMWEHATIAPHRKRELAVPHHHIALETKANSV